MAERSTKTTRLVAVNTMLRTINEAPAASLEETQRGDLVNAESDLDESSFAVQSMGWWFNTETRTLTPDGDGKMPLPDNALSIDLSDKRPTDELVERGGFLYNLTTNSYTGYTDSIEVELILLLPFETLPEQARRYIMMRAARKFADREVNDPTLTRATGLDEIEALTRLEDEESMNSDANMLNDPQLQKGVNRWLS